MRFDVVVANPPFSLDKWARTTLKRTHTAGSCAASAEVEGRLRLHPPHACKSRARARVACSRRPAWRPLPRRRRRAQSRERLVRDNLLDVVVGLRHSSFDDRHSGCVSCSTALGALAAAREHSAMCCLSTRAAICCRQENRTCCGRGCSEDRPRRPRARGDRALLARRDFDEIERTSSPEHPPLLEPFEPEAEIDIQAVQNEIRDLDRQPPNPCRDEPLPQGPA